MTIELFDVQNVCIRGWSIEIRTRSLALPISLIESKSCIDTFFPGNSNCRDLELTVFSKQAKSSLNINQVILKIYISETTSHYTDENSVET